MTTQEPQDVDSGEARIRRAPRLGRFLFLGGVVGVLGTLIVTSLYPADPNVGFAALFGYFCIYGVPIGVALGGLLALILDRRSLKRSKTVSVEHEHIEEPEQEALPPVAD